MDKEGSSPLDIPMAVGYLMIVSLFFLWPKEPIKTPLNVFIMLSFPVWCLRAFADVSWGKLFLAVVAIPIISLVAVVALVNSVLAIAVLTAASVLLTYHYRLHLLGLGRELWSAARNKA